MCKCTSQQPELGGLEKKFFEILDKYQGQEGALIPVLQETQEIFGYISEQSIMTIAQKLNLPPSKVYGVATFYAQFHLEPRGKYIIRVCLGTACHVRGAAKILEAIQNHLQIKNGETTEDLKYTIEAVACIGACGLAPVIMVNDDTHGRLSPNKIPEILARYE